MASISSMMVNGSSSLSSIYGNRNVLSGLASGMDTESMIENAVSGIKKKIQSLIQKRTKVEWQQEAYRSIIDKAVNFNNKYTSYSSKTNLLSSSFFTNAVNTAVKGTYADKLTASGKSSSDIKINAVKQLAKAASYTVSGLGGVAGDVSTIVGDSFDISKDLDVSNVSGSLTFQYGGSNGASFTVNFDELENLNEVKVYNEDGSEKTDASDAEKLAQAINNKLGEVTYTYTKNGFQETTTADKAVKVTANADGRIAFSDGLGNGNTVKISSSTGNMKKYAGENVIVPPSGELSKKVPTYEYLAGKKGDDGKWSGGKELGITFNGTTKKISMSDIMNEVDGKFSYDSGKSKDELFMNALQSQVDKAFGTGKVKVSHDGENGPLSFKTDEGSTLSLGGSAVEALGFESGDSNYINPQKKLSDILGENFSPENRLKAVGDVNTDRMMDSAGNRVKKAEDGSYYRVDKDGKALYDFKVNGASITVNEDTTLESLMNSINSSAEAGVKVSYSKLTNEFKFTATETGSNGKIEFSGLAKDLFAAHGRSGSDSFVETYGVGISEGKSERVYFNLPGYVTSFMVSSEDSMEYIADRINKGGAGNFFKASYDDTTGQILVTDKQTGQQVDFKLSLDNRLSAGGTEIEKPDFGSSYTSGQDAIMDVEINGKRFEDLTRSTNSFDIDGLTINLKGAFEAKAAEEGKDYEPITFETTTDTEKIIDVIREFVNDYNEMATEIKNAYSTQPLTDSSKNRYNPLTSDQEEGMTESEIAAYNEKAKTGILFGDTTLSSFYSKLLSAIAPGGTDGQTLREIGIGTSYSNGMTTLSLDEDKLRTALESDPDKVKNAFTKTKEGGSASDGLMQTMQNTLNTYVKTTGEPKGALIVRAGSAKAPTSLNNNSLKNQIDSYDSQIDRWQDKMSAQIDRYTTQFSRLEQLIAQMNSQASAFSGLMGGNSGY